MSRNKARNVYRNLVAWYIVVGAIVDKKWNSVTDTELRFLERAAAMRKMAFDLEDEIKGLDLEPLVAKQWRRACRNVINVTEGMV